MAQLNDVANDLVAVLEKSAATLDYVSQKLEHEFADRFGTSGVNPLQLSKRIKRLERYESVVMLDAVLKFSVLMRPTLDEVEVSHI